jgi:hypothetical protein
MNKLSPSDYAAWWGAIIATFVFFWDIIKWKQSGPRLKVTFSQSSIGSLDVMVTNIGDGNAGLESVSVCLCQKRFGRRIRVFQMPYGYFVGKIHEPRLPVALEPGQSWETAFTPIVNPTADGRQRITPRHSFKLPDSGLCFVIEIGESHSKKPLRFYPHPNFLNVKPFMGLSESVDDVTAVGQSH